MTVNSAELPGHGLSTNDAAAGDSIKVSVRFRPLNRVESKKERDPAWRVFGDGGDGDDDENGKIPNTVVQKKGEQILGQSLFAFDAAFDPSHTTEEVYDGVCRQVVCGALEGVNGTIFAYGQTGSGKTFTMQGAGAGEGGGDGDGIIQMAAKQLFMHVESQPGREFLVRTSFIEIYNENMMDLLHSDERNNGGGSESGSRTNHGVKGRGSDTHPLTVREDPNRGGVYVNCQEVIATNLDSLMETLRDGEKNRTVAATGMNEQSSRSHALFRITLESRVRRRDSANSSETSQSTEDDSDDDYDDRAVLVSTLNLVDLAGSESVRHSGATGQRQREGGMINQSLLTLSQVIYSLSLPPSKRPRHINYRDSKLTRILQPSLSGNSRMAVLCCASLSPLYMEETRSTLKFASRAKMVHLKAVKNEVLDDRALIRTLQKQLAEAKKALALAEVREEKGLPQASDLAPTTASKEVTSSTMAPKDPVDGSTKDHSVKAEQERLRRLKSMILSGGTFFGGEGQKNLRQKAKRSYSHRGIFMNSTTIGSPPAFLDAGSVEPKDDAKLPDVKRQKLHKMHSVGTLQIAHHNDAEVLLQIYESDEESVDDGPGPTPPRPLLTGEKEVPLPSLPQMKKSSSSPTDIFREALSSKSGLVSSLESQLQSAHDRAELLQSLLETALTKETEVHSQLESALIREKKANELADAKIKRAHFFYHVLFVISASALLFFMENIVQYNRG